MKIRVHQTYYYFPFNFWYIPYAHITRTRTGAHIQPSVLEFYARRLIIYKANLSIYIHKQTLTGWFEKCSRQWIWNDVFSLEKSIEFLTLMIFLVIFGVSTFRIWKKKLYRKSSFFGRLSDSRLFLLLSEIKTLPSLVSSSVVLKLHLSCT